MAVPPLPLTSPRPRTERDVTAVFLFNAKGRVLMLERDKGGKRYPGGDIDRERGTAIDNACRILEEKPGVNNATLSFIAICRVHNPKDNTTKRVHAYLALVPDPDNIQLSLPRRGKIKRAFFADVGRAVDLYSAYAHILRDAAAVHKVRSLAYKV